MLYYFSLWLNKYMDVPGMGVFHYISFRAAMAAITSLVITIVFGKRLIEILLRKQVGETVRDLGLVGQKEKQGTPTMGGLIIIAGIITPTILWAKIDNIYILMMLFTTLWMGTIGFLDDYIKVFKKNKNGLAGKFKILGQVVLGLIIGLTMCLHPEIVVRESPLTNTSAQASSTKQHTDDPTVSGFYVKALKTNVPFYKNNEFSYEKVLEFLGGNYRLFAPYVFVIAVIIIIAAVSNGANITDGLDGLATGTSAIIGLALGILAYLSGNFIFADYLNIVYVPNSGELMVFSGAFIGACIGFLWYNTYPAQVFMGDTGSLMLGGVIASFAIITRKELLLPVLCGVFLIENLSVIMQVSYFKYTKRKTGEGKRIFLMSPLHHHFQKKGVHEAKIVARFWIIGVLLAVISIVTLKIR